MFPVCALRYYGIARVDRRDSAIHESVQLITELFSQEKLYNVEFTIGVALRLFFDHLVRVLGDVAVRIRKMRAVKSHSVGRSVGPLDKLVSGRLFATRLEHDWHVYVFALVPYSVCVPLTTKPVPDPRAARGVDVHNEVDAVWISHL